MMGQIPNVPLFTAFTSEELKSCCLGIKDPIGWHAAMARLLPQQGIDTPKRLAAFVAQCGHESANFNILSENLNYSWDGLRRIFPKYFPDELIAKQYERQPEKIANRVYANRMGNGDEKSGDGFRFRGRGVLQLTGKNNYRECSMALYTDERLTADPSPIAKQDGALLSACWFWRKNNLNKWIDVDDFDGLSDVINRGHKTSNVGDAHGYEDRKARYTKCLAALGIHAPTPSIKHA
jgi:putative chitinase